MAKRLFIRAFVLLILIGLLDFIADKFYLYWTLHWFDSVLHFISGVCIAVGGISTWLLIFNNGNHSKKRILTIGLLFVAIIGILWEFFELRFGITSLSDGIHYATDTTLDVFLDMLGGFLGSLYSYRFLSNNNE